MRSVGAGHRCFSTKLVVGLALGGVAIVLAGAARRERRTHPAVERGRFIDGVRRPTEAELDARPQEEANAVSGRLVSEADEVFIISERW